MVIAIVYPHQLFRHNPALEGADYVYLIEDPLMFGNDRDCPHRMHLQKLVMYRAAMRHYAHAIHLPYRYLHAGAYATTECTLDEVRKLATQVHIVDVVDGLLEERIRAFFAQYKVPVIWFESPSFLTPGAWGGAFFQRGKPALGKFYRAQRQRMGILMEGCQPEGGKWSFEQDNHKLLPNTIQPPAEPHAKEMSNEELKKIVEEFELEGISSYGEARVFRYPITRQGAVQWLETFLQERFELFGPYEEALSTRGHVLFHSGLSPMLNNGLLTPHEVVTRALEMGRRQGVPLNSLEGFLRQVIGLREFMKLLYEYHGKSMRRQNFMGSNDSIPPCFYDGISGFDPVDCVLQGVRESGYAHPSERLTVLGNFMLLLRIHPDKVFHWFMEMFVDGYDWLMVPNIYGMSQLCDGGKCVTKKPYLVNSQQLLAISDYPQGEWCEAWDALYWSFLDDHRSFFKTDVNMLEATRQLQALGSSRLRKYQRLAREVRACLQRGEAWGKEGLMGSQRIDQP